MELVSVQYEYEYTAKDGHLVSIKPNEHYILVSKTNEHWWHVRKDEHSRPFYVPAQYVKEICSPTEGSPGTNKMDSTECVTESKPVDIDTAQHKPTIPTCVSFKDASRNTYEFSTFGLRDNRPDLNPCETLRGGQTTSSLAPTIDKIKTLNSKGAFSVSSAPLKTNGLQLHTKVQIENRQHQSEMTLQDNKTEQPQIFVEDVDINLPLACNSPIYDTIPELNIPQNDTFAELPSPDSSNDISPSQQHSLNQAAETLPTTNTLSLEQELGKCCSSVEQTQSHAEKLLQQVENESPRSAVYVNVAQLRQSISESPPSASSSYSPSNLNPEEWEVHFDQESNQEYYYHPATGRTTWDCPFLDSPTDPELPSAEEACSPSSPQSPVFCPSSPTAWTSDWEQLVDETSGRPYFYNPMSGQTSWEPPEQLSPYPPLMEPMSVHRFHEDQPPPLPVEDYPSEDYPATDQQETYEDLHATGLPTIPKDYTLSHVNRTIIPRANLDRSAPTGWNLTVEHNGTWVFTSEHSADEWIKSVDDRGQTYYYLRDGSKSQWNLPEAPVAPGHSRVENGIETETVSVFKNWRHTVCPAHFSLTQDDARSVQSHRRNTSDSCSDSSSTGNSPETQSNVQNLEKAGILNKTKVSENGKKVRKNWMQTWTVLHGGVLTFHKDPKSAATGALNKTNQIVPEVTVDLRGATICWASKDKSSKKNVLELKGKNGVEFLIQYDTESIISDWHKVLMDTIRQLEYQDHHSEEEDGDLYEKIPSTERDDKSGGVIDKRRSVRPSSTTSSSSAQDTDQKRVRTKLMKFLMKRPTLQSVKEKGYIRDNVFGCHLATLCTQERSTVPSFVEKCIKAVEKRGLDIDGLYRVSGNLAVIQKLRFKADHEELDLEDGQWEDVHVITGALKLFFRELPEPLFPFSHFNDFIDAIKISDCTTKFNRIQYLVKSLSSANHDTMEILFGHLRRVIKYGDNNRMTVQNVAIVFGPTLLRPETESSNIAVHMVCQNQIVEFILNQYERIFHSS